MKQKAEFNKGIALEALRVANIKYDSFNNDLHWKIGSIDFWPTSLKWNDNYKNTKGQGVFQLIEHLRMTYPSHTYNPYNKNIFPKTLSPDQIFDIAKKVKPMNLNAVCEAIHKEIYG